MASAPQRVTIRIPAWPAQLRERNLLGLEHQEDPRLVPGHDSGTSSVKEFFTERLKGVL